jgi:hypothetical protein
VQDLSLVDNVPRLAPYISAACARNQTVREAFPVPTWVALLPAVKPKPTDPSPSLVKLEETEDGQVQEIEAMPRPLKTDSNSIILPCKSPGSEGSVAIKEEFERSG